MDDVRRAARAVEARRGELGMTQQQLAEAASVDIKTIGNLESRGRWPIARTRARIEAALGWPSGELARIASDGEPPRPPPARLSEETKALMREEVGEEMAAALIAHAEHLASRPPAAGRGDPAAEPGTTARRSAG